MIHRRLHLPNRQSHQSRVTLTVIILATICLVITNFFLSAELSHLGLSLTINSEKIRSLEQARATVYQELARSTSLTDLELQAQNLGYVNEVDYLNLPTIETIALK